MTEAAIRGRRALAIGIDAYPRLGPTGQLHGCVNDVELMRDVLTSNFGFDSAQISLLRNAEATRDAILAALEQLVSETVVDDLVVIHYSGHGSQMTDREGDEADGLDETLVPYDSGRAPHPNRDISDDELHGFLTRLTALTPFVTLVFDCCHSGTITRDAFGARARWVAPDTRPVAELPPSPVAGSPARELAAKGPSGWLTFGHRHVLLAGCRSDESSYEIDAEDGTPHGALTFFLAQELLNAPAGTSYRDVFERAAPRVSAVQPRQHPQLEGFADRVLFEAAEVARSPYVPVHARGERSVTLAAGAAHGATVGSRWSVHHAGGHGVAMVEIQTVDAVRSVATIVAQTAPIEPGARAIEESHRYPDLRLCVELVAPDGPALDAVRDALAAAGPLRLGEARDAADVRVYLLGARSSAGCADAVPQLGALHADSWVAVGRDGRVQVPPRRADSEAPSRLREDLIRVARHRRALELDNHDTSSPLRGRVDLQLLRVGPDGRWIEASNDEVAGMPVFDEHDRIALRLVSSHDRPVWVTVLDFGLSYRIERVYPYGPSALLAPGVSVGVADDPGGGFPLQIPADFPFAPEPAGDVPSSAGVETVKLFATTEQADFTALTQDGVRRGSGPASQLDALLEFAATGQGTRDIGRRTGEDWTTVTRSFELRRRAAGTPLRPDGAPVRLGATTIIGRHLLGNALADAVDLHPGPLDRALASSGAARQALVVLRDVEVEAGARAAPSLTIEAPDPGEDQGQFMLHRDEAGLLTWHFPVGARGGPPVYELEQRLIVPPADPSQRGFLSAIGNKVLEVVVFPLVETGIGRIGDYFAEKWEAAKRPYRLRHVGSSDLATPGRDLGADDWTRLSAGPVLGLVHGTFSRTHTAFGRLDPDWLGRLANVYDERVIGFDHYTLSHDPLQNLGELIRRIPEGATLELDLLCHSRGGLVARALAEHASAVSLGSRRVSVRRVIMVATPNAGTVLADGDHFGDLIDVYTNLLSLVPDNGITEVLEAIVTVAKLLAVGTLKGLDGLASMAPGGDFLRRLNQQPAPGETVYHAIAADYEPPTTGVAAYARDWVTDKLFASAPNDLVVPTAGVHAANGAAAFPIVLPELFAAHERVSHNDFFSSPRAREAILRWCSSSC